MYANDIFLDTLVIIYIVCMYVATVVTYVRIYIRTHHNYYMLHTRQYVC